jgi:hypothetical protein
MIVDKYGNCVRKFMWQLCGWDRVDICMTFHKRAFDFFIPLTGSKLLLLLTSTSKFLPVGLTSNHTNFVIFVIFVIQSNDYSMFVFIMHNKIIQKITFTLMLPPQAIIYNLMFLLDCVSHI